MMKTLTAAAAALFITLSGTVSVSHAHGIDSKSVAWGLGGLMAGSMYSDSKQRHEQRLRRPVYYSAPVTAVPVTVTRAAPAETMTPEQKMAQLNKLAAGGYITPAEYKSEKQAILNSIAE